MTAARDRWFGVAVSRGLGAFRAAAPVLRWRVERTLANRYDDRTASFLGGEMETLTHRNYERSLANLWKAELVAPYLGIRDASLADKAGASLGTVVGDLTRERRAPTRDAAALVELVQSDDVRRELRNAYTLEQREAICQIMSLLVHGEAYALYTSSTLLPIVQGTGAKLGMAMQVMEEAKHFVVLRAMLETLDGVRPLQASARILFEVIARKRYYHKLFGMNVVLESFATNLFAQFEDYPGLRHIMRPFHMDEARHCAFPQTYAALGNIPDHVTHEPKYQRARVRMLLPAIPLLFDYKPHFETLGLDAFLFFGRFLGKVDRLATRSGFPVPDGTVQAVNALLNRYRRALEPERYAGFVDYTALHSGAISDDMASRERVVFA